MAGTGTVDWKVEEDFKMCRGKDNSTTSVDLAQPIKEKAIFPAVMKKYNMGTQQVKQPCWLYISWMI